MVAQDPSVADSPSSSTPRTSHVSSLNQIGCGSQFGSAIAKASSSAAGHLPSILRSKSTKNRPTQLGSKLTTPTSRSSSRASTRSSNTSRDGMDNDTSNSIAAQKSQPITSPHKANPSMRHEHGSTSSVGGHNQQQQQQLQNLSSTWRQKLKRMETSTNAQKMELESKLRLAQSTEYALRQELTSFRQRDRGQQQLKQKCERIHQQYKKAKEEMSLAKKQLNQEKEASSAQLEQLKEDLTKYKSQLRDATEGTMLMGTDHLKDKRKLSKMMSDVLQENKANKELVEKQTKEIEALKSTVTKLQKDSSASTPAPMNLSQVTVSLMESSSGSTSTSTSSQPSTMASSSSGSQMDCSSASTFQLLEDDLKRCRSNEAKLRVELKKERHLRERAEARLSQLSSQLQNVEHRRQLEQVTFSISDKSSSTVISNDTTFESSVISRPEMLRNEKLRLMHRRIEHLEAENKALQTKMNEKSLESEINETRLKNEIYILRAKLQSSEGKDNVPSTEKGGGGPEVCGGEAESQNMKPVHVNTIAQLKARMAGIKQQLQKSKATELDETMAISSNTSSTDISQADSLVSSSQVSSSPSQLSPVNIVQKNEGTAMGRPIQSAFNNTASSLSHAPTLDSQLSTAADHGSVLDDEISVSAFETGPMDEIRSDIGSQTTVLMSSTQNNNVRRLRERMAKARLQFETAIGSTSSVALHTSNHSTNHDELVGNESQSSFLNDETSDMEDLGLSSCPSDEFGPRTAVQKGSLEDSPTDETDTKTEVAINANTDATGTSEPSMASIHNRMSLQCLCSSGDETDIQCTDATLPRTDGYLTFPPQHRDVSSGPSEEERDESIELRKVVQHGDDAELRRGVSPTSDDVSTATNMNTKASLTDSVGLHSRLKGENPFSFYINQVLDTSSPKGRPQGISVSPIGTAKNNLSAPHSLVSTPASQTADDAIEMGLGTLNENEEWQLPSLRPMASRGSPETSDQDKPVLPTRQDKSTARTPPRPKSQSQYLQLRTQGKVVYEPEPVQPKRQVKRSLFDDDDTDDDVDEDVDLDLSLNVQINYDTNTDADVSHIDGTLDTQIDKDTNTDSDVDPIDKSLHTSSSDDGDMPAQPSKSEKYNNDAEDHVHTLNAVYCDGDNIEVTEVRYMDI